jgi:glycine/D-amino acid oxidase-like deaminating enzyme
MTAGIADPTLVEPTRLTPIRHEADVLVVGGGSAGVAAAVAAARAGADTLLVERYGYLGGLATGGLIILLLTLDDGRGRQVVAGLCQEVTERLSKRGAAHFPPPEIWGSQNADRVEQERRWGLVWGHAPHAVRYSVAYDPEALKFVLDEMVTESGVRMLFHAWGCEPLIEDGHVTAVCFQGKSGRFAVRARVVVDATGDGDLFAAAGCAHEKERVLPWLWFTVGGVDDVEAALERGGSFFRTLGEGRVLFPWGATEKLSERIDATSPEDLSRAELACRKQVMQQFDRLRHDTPGFENAHLCRVADQLGITESRRLSGRFVVTRANMDEPRADAVAVTGHWTRYGAVYCIPYGSLLPRELSNLLVAGRCISVDHRVHHATKEIPCCMATGQAAGTAAALALAEGTEVGRLEPASLREELTRAGAIVSI